MSGASERANGRASGLALKRAYSLIFLLTVVCPLPPPSFPLIFSTLIVISSELALPTPLSLPLLPALPKAGDRKNFKLGTELNLAGVKLTPPKALRVGEGDEAVVLAEDMVVEVVVVVVEVTAVDNFEGGGERSLLEGFFAVTTGFPNDDDDDVVVGDETDDDGDDDDVTGGGETVATCGERLRTASIVENVVQ